MSWNTTRQLLFALGALALIVAVGVGGYYSFIYKAPSCTDAVQNQNEEGVDCGGVCARLCVLPNITTLWSRSVPVAPGVYHAVALVKNPDTAATGVVPYSVSLFDVNNILVATREGELRLFPGENAPLFEANIITGERVPVRTFVDIGQGAFTKMEREVSPVKILSFDVEVERGRVTAVIENQTPFNVENIEITALLFDKEDVVRFASQTHVAVLAPRERKEIVFTWQKPFDEAPTRVDIIPRVLP